MSAAGDDLVELRAALRADAAGVAEALLGPPNKAASTRDTLRWGSKGSLSVEVRGPRRGLWYRHEGDVGSNLLGLIRAEHGCSFPEAVAWARNWTGIDADRAEPFKLPARRRAPPPPDEDEAAEVAAERAGKIGRARHIVAGGVPVAGTLGEYYLKQVRGIASPADGWPAPILWHPECRAVLAVATTTDGTVQAVQRVHLAEDGGKVGAEEMQRRRLPRVKLTNGFKDGAVVRLPGDPAGPLLLAEGPETGLAVYTSTGFETWIALGGVGKLTPPTGRRVVVIADDNPSAHDAHHGQAAKALREAERRWRRAGIDLVVATPWRNRRHDKSDMADVILAHGPEAVRARIVWALDAGRSAIRRVPLSVARTRTAQVIQAFTTRAAASAELFVYAMRVATGVGKSREARRLGAALIRALRKKGDGRTLAIAVPRHALADEYARKLRQTAPDLVVRVWRGREAADPDATTGARMCQDTDLVADVQAAFLEPDTYACAPCAFASGCAYLRQRKSQADVWIIPHELLTHTLPKALGTLAALIVDESPVDAFLVGSAATRPGSQGEGQDCPVHLSLDALDRATCIEGDLLASDRLRDLRRQALDVLRRGNLGPALRSDFLAAGLTPEAAEEASTLEWRTKCEPEITAGMSREQRCDAVRAMTANRDLGRRVMWWSTLAALLAEGGPEASGWASLAMIEGGAGPQRVLALRQRRAVAKNWQVPTLILDATMEPELLRYIWPDLELVADIAAAAPHMHVSQVTDRAYSLAMFDSDRAKKPTEVQRRRNRLRDLHAVIAREARRYAPGRVLVVAQKRVRAHLEGMGALPPTVEWAHHGAVTGLDDWRDVRALILIGRTMPSPADVEAQAEALTGVAIPPLKGWYPRVDATREMADGSLVATEADAHPDPIAEAFRRQACEHELMQIIGRPRGGDRGPSDPVDVLVLTDVPLNLPVAQLVSAADFEPSPVDRMLAEGGVALLNPRDIEIVYPDLWPSRGAAKAALRRDQRGTNPNRDLIGICTPLVRVRYQVTGERRHHVEALTDLTMVPDARAWLEARLGTLVAFELVEPPPVESRAVPAQPRSVPAMPIPLPAARDTPCWPDVENDGWPLGPISPPWWTGPVTAWGTA